VNAPTNAEVADFLDKLAGILADEGAPPDRTHVWRSAANAVRGLARSVADVMTRGGAPAVAALPGVGDGLALIIAAMLDNAEQPPLALAS
jgi:DNA polymerase/3'-5' exonuclease PolX